MDATTQKPYQGPCFKLWLKFWPTYAETQDGTATLTNKIRHESRRDKVLNKTTRKMWKHINSGRIMKCKIYEHPGNKLVDQWNTPFNKRQKSPP